MWLKVQLRIAESQVPQETMHQGTARPNHRNATSNTCTSILEKKYSYWIILEIVILDPIFLHLHVCILDHSGKFHRIYIFFGGVELQNVCSSKVPSGPATRKATAFCLGDNVTVVDC